MFIQIRAKTNSQADEFGTAIINPCDIVSVDNCFSVESPKLATEDVISKICMKNGYAYWTDMTLEEIAEASKMKVEDFTAQTC